MTNSVNFKYSKEKGIKKNFNKVRLKFSQELDEPYPTQPSLTISTISKPKFVSKAVISPPVENKTKIWLESDGLGSYFDSFLEKRIRSHGVPQKKEIER
jgi:hypothetical protein